MKLGLRYPSYSIHLKGIRSWIYCICLGIFCSCNKSEQTADGTIKLSFISNFGSEFFNALQPYAYAGKQSIKFNNFEFFVTGVQLSGTNGLINLDYHGKMSLTGSNSSDRTLTWTGIKAGDYTSIRFTVGVTSILNKKLPKDFNSSDPLSSTSDYWDAWNSYIFSKIEGVVDTGGLKTFDLGFAIHTGTDASAQVATISKPFTVIENQTTAIALNLDVKAVFTSSGQFFDLVKNPLNHNPTNIDILKGFSERLVNAIQLKQ